MPLRFRRRERPPTHPIVDPAAPFLGAFMDLSRARRNWQLAAFGVLFLATLLGGAYIRLASQSRITPYVVEVDRLGRAVAFGPAEQLRPTDNRIVVAELSRFISEVRTVYFDPAAERDALWRAYAYATPETAALLDAYFRDHDPRLVATRLSRRVEIESVLQIPKSQTWRVQWTEIDTPLVAGAVVRSAWEGYFTIALHPPKTADAVQSNPIGLFVRAITWTRIASPTNPGAR